jgi:hypothetical protein
MRASTGCAAALGSLLLCSPTGGCEARNLGQAPPAERFFFPSGVLVDPLDRGPAPPGELEGPRYLYVANGNNDRSFNAGTLLAVDLQQFWRAWYDPQQGGVDPYCGDVRCVLPPGSPIAESGELPERPCRRLPLIPQVVECDERSFVVAGVHVGDFATTLASSLEDGRVRLWLPVRGDPSITYVDVDAADADGDGNLLACDQGGDPLDPELCGDRHRLDDLRNEPALERIDREPFNAVVWERKDPSPDPDARGQRLVFVAHADGTQLSLVDLDGVRGGSEPAIVDLASVYQTPGGAAGGYGLAVRPCFAAGEGPLGAADPLANVPTLTQGCTRPLVYTSFRFAGQLASFTASGIELGGAVAELVPPSERVGCTVALHERCHIVGGGPSERADQVLCEAGIDPATAADCDGGGCREVVAGSYCATPEQLDQPCAVECEPQVRSTRRIQTTLLLDTSGSSAPVLGAMAFGDPRGDQLLVLQTNPGALLSLDTSLGDGAEPLDIPSAPPVEICAEPSNMKIHIERGDDGAPAQRYAIISCFRAALVYVVDLEALRVVAAVVVGTGPHDIAIDEAREVAYVINNLESSISVIDLSRRRATRFQELARLGLQDPFSQ